MRTWRRAAIGRRRPNSGNSCSAFRSGKPLSCVTHQVNITALTGWAPVSGEVFLLRVGRDGTISVVDEILIGP